jgi:phytoene/squalene synthetase
MAFDSDLVACADLVRRGDPDRFRAVMAAPVAARARLFPVYAFNIEVSRAPWLTQEPMIAEMRLQWWRDVLDEIRERGTARRHEVATTLAGVIGAPEAALLDGLVTARRWDVYREPFEDTDHFREYITATSANLLLVAGRGLGQAPDAPLRDAGYALGLANWLRAVPALERAGRIPLVEGTHAALRALAEEGLDRLARARAARRDVPAAVRPALLAAWQAGPVLRAARRAPARVGDGALEPSPFRGRAALMARAATGLW